MTSDEGLKPEGAPERSPKAGVVGEITMDNELLSAKIAALEGKRPLAPRRSRR